MPGCIQGDGDLTPEEKKKFAKRFNIPLHWVNEETFKELSRGPRKVGPDGKHWAESIEKWKKRTDLERDEETLRLFKPFNGEEEANEPTA